MDRIDKTGLGRQIEAVAANSGSTIAYLQLPLAVSYLLHLMLHPGFNQLTVSALAWNWLSVQCC